MFSHFKFFYPWFLSVFLNFKTLQIVPLPLQRLPNGRQV